MSNYNKNPFFPIKGELFSGWEAINNKLKAKISESTKENYVLVVECYHGVHHSELIAELQKLNPTTFIHSAEAFYPEDKIREITYPDVTDDAIFGYIL